MKNDFLFAYRLFAWIIRKTVSPFTEDFQKKVVNFRNWFLSDLIELK